MKRGRLQPLFEWRLGSCRIGGFGSNQLLSEVADCRRLAYSILHTSGSLKRPAMRATRKVIVLFCSLILFDASLAWSQATTSLSGRVTDSSGARLVGAIVTLTSNETGAVRRDITNQSGEYQFAQLAPGHYLVVIEVSGFSPWHHSLIELLVDQPATVNAVLSLASVSTQTIVSASLEPILNTTDATIGNAFTARQIEDLPSEARSTPTLLSLQPGVTYLGPGNGNSVNDARTGATDGGRPDQANITLDGIDVNDINNGFAFTSVLRVSPDSVAEFRVITSNPNADQGRSSGAQVALVTKSGTNALHGALYEYNRSNLLEANDFFNQQLERSQDLPNRPLQLVYNVFGVAAGGPLKHDRVFLFFNYEGQRQAIGGVSNNDLVPTASFRAGNLTYACAQTSQCSLTSSSTPGVTYNTLTAAQIESMDPLGIGVSSAMQVLLNSYPLPNNPLAGDGFNSEGYSFAYSVKPSYNAYTTRFDFNLTPRQTAFWRGNLQDDSQPGGPTFPGQPPSTTNHNNSRGFASGYTLLFNSNLLNTVDFGLTRQGLNASGLLSQPYISFIFSPPEATSPTSSTSVAVYNLVDNLSWTHRNHNFSFGTNMRFINDRGSSNATAFSNAGGVAIYLPQSIAGSGGAFDPVAYWFPSVARQARNVYNNDLLDITGILTEGNVTYNTTKTGGALPIGAPVVRDYRWNEYGFYAQDSWKTTKNLTLTYGLRYSYQQAPAETTGTQVGVCQVVNGACAPKPFSLTQFVERSAQLAAADQPANNAGELGFPLNGRYNGKPDYWTPDKLDFAPRLAAAYSPRPNSGFLQRLFGDGATSIRGGYSLVYDHFGAAIANTFDVSGSYGLSTVLATTPGTFTVSSAPRFSNLHTVPSVLLPSAPTVGFPGVPVSSGPASAAIYWSEDSAIKTPYARVFDFSMTREIRNGSSLEVAYVGRFARRLLEQEDVAMPTNLQAAGTTYFAAARQLATLVRANTPVASIKPIAYWQTLFGVLDGQDIGFGSGLSATQNVYHLFAQFAGNETQALYNLDLPNSVSNAGVNPNQTYPSYRFYHDQFSSLYGWRSVGSSSFNALEVIYRQRFGFGLQADFNYTYSKSLDWTSQAERLPVSGLDNDGQIINTWNPSELYGDSDFDMRHQVNANYIWNLPVGQGKRFATGIGRVLDGVIGGWQLTGIVRWTSGLPVGVMNGLSFPTNWDIEGYATQITSVPARGHEVNQSLQQLFQSPSAAYNAFGKTLPGDSGTRNPIRGDGYFGWDAGLGKSFSFVENKQLKIGVEIFNLTNSVRFDPRSISLSLDNPNSFGVANSTLTDYRRTQFYARFEF